MPSTKPAAPDATTGEKPSRQRQGRGSFAGGRASTSHCSLSSAMITPPGHRFERNRCP
ncbi:hypothetical protein GGE48_005547 [Rhizobium leguminosarum]|nr:hypothetical protein [Rhizobium leguminosarum]